jgi:predicted TIM-barrel fold metal-dependent hydrolase
MGIPGIERIVDGDGHVLEDKEAIKKHLPREWQDNTTTRTLGVFPHLDHLHHVLARNPPGAFQDPSPSGWVRFLDALGFDAAVLYPTDGLAFGKMIDVDLAIGTARAYNDWLYDAYLQRDPRLKGIGLLPLQEPEAAIAELRRAVTELGMVGGLLPSTGLKTHLGDKLYWPVYAEADRLGCCLSVHGGAHSGLGFDQLNVFAAIHALGHPFGITIAFASLVINGIFERFPNARFGFLEGGVGWFLMALERLTGSYQAFTPYDPRGEFLQLAPGESVADYIVRHVKARRIFVGVEGGEPALAYAVRTVGPEAFVYSSDFPHEVNVDTCRHEVEEIVANAELTVADKRAIFYQNAEHLYGLARAAEATAARGAG